MIVPNSEQRKVITQLPDFESPEITTYSLESTIAEKFDAILQRFELTGRMKDFFDIYYLAKTFDFDGLKHQKAIFETLKNRGTSFYEYSFVRIAELEEDADMQIKWRYFLKNIKTDTLEFKMVISGIKIFLEPVIDAILVEDPFRKHWSS